MRTIQTNIYEFHELSEDSKNVAIENYRRKYGGETDHIYNEAHQTVKAFHEVFRTKEGNRSWLDVNTGQVEDDVCNMQGLRLHKYILNNFYSQLYLKKKYRLTSKTRNELLRCPIIKSRYSKLSFENCCVLTGWCYDDSILEPIYQFLEKFQEKAGYYSSMDFNELMGDCFHALKKDLDSEVEAMQQDEYITENIEANNYEFTENGQSF